MNPTRTLPARETTPHEAPPSRWEHAWMWPVLLIVAAGDFVAFYFILSTAIPTDERLTFVLTVAMTAAAVLLMHIAGRLQREHHAHGSHGPGKHRLLVLLWLLLGLVAFGFRMSYELSKSVDGGFGADPTSSWWSPEALPLSLLLLALFLVGGAGAFVIGYLAHNPEHKPSLRLRSATRWAERRLESAEKTAAKRQVAFARVASLDEARQAALEALVESAKIRSESIRQGSRQRLLRRLRADVATAERALESAEELAADAISAPARLGESGVDLDVDGWWPATSALESSTEDMTTRAALLREQARLLLLRALREPQSVPALEHAEAAVQVALDEYADTQVGIWESRFAQEIDDAPMSDMARADFDVLRALVALRHSTHATSRLRQAASTADDDFELATSGLIDARASLTELSHLLRAEPDVNAHDMDLLRSRAEEFKQRVRVRMAEATGDPAATSALLPNPEPRDEV